MSTRTASFFLFFVLFHNTCISAQQVLYVDPEIDRFRTDKYDPATRGSDSGSESAYSTLRSAARIARPGQTVLIRGGTYQEQLIPLTSGAEGRPITFKNYEQEKVIITGSTLMPAIDISRRNHLIIEGLTVTNVRRWLYAVNSHHNLIRGNHFSKAVDPYNSSKTGLFFQEATFNRIIDNTIEDSEADNLTLIKSDRNLVEGNRITGAQHAVWTIKGGNFNVLRNNFFYNDRQKIGEVYDCEDVGFNHEFREQNCTKYNLIERNIFAGTRFSTANHRYNAIQYGAQNGIVRHNLFYNNAGGGIGFHTYGYESKYKLDNRIYHNVFYNNHPFALTFGRGGPNNLSGNIFVNNILYRNYGPEKTPTQIFLSGEALVGFFFRNNNLCAEKAGMDIINHRGTTEPLAIWQQQRANLFIDNLEFDPLFLDEEKHDFRLKPDSPLIDAGAFLTECVEDGSGKTLKVKDTGFFFDGYGIPGQRGDVIQLQGQTQTARIVTIDYQKHVLTLDQPLEWTQGQGVALRHNGKSPDIGAYENPTPQGDIIGRKFPEAAESSR